MVTFTENLGPQTRYVLPVYDTKSAAWPKHSARLAIKTLFGDTAEGSGEADYSFCGIDGKRYDVCVETMTLAPNSKASVIVPMRRLARGMHAGHKIVLAVFGRRDIRGLDCEIAGWVRGGEVRRWEAPEDKLLFKRKGRRFAIVPRERLAPVNLLVRMVDDWRCAL